MNIILSNCNKICIKQNDQLIEFEPELATEIIHGLTIALAEAGRRNKTTTESVVLEIPEKVPEVTAYDLDD